MFEEQITKGIAWLDGVQSDWRSKIDPETLNLGSVSSCVLGQTQEDGFMGAVSRGVKGKRQKYGITPKGWQWAIEHGFAAHYPDGRDYVEGRDYEVLTAEWKAALSAVSD